MSVEAVEGASRVLLLRYSQWGGEGLVDGISRVFEFAGVVDGHGQLPEVVHGIILLGKIRRKVHIPPIASDNIWRSYRSVRARAPMLASEKVDPQHSWVIGSA